MSRNCLFVTPWVCDFSLYDLWIRPAGLLRYAAYCRTKGDNIYYLNLLQNYTRRDLYGCGKFSKHFFQKPQPIAHIDRSYYIYGLTKQEALERLKSFPAPDIIYIGTGMTYWYPGVKKTIEFLRTIYPHPPIFLGGIYATLCRMHAEKYLDIQGIITPSPLPHIWPAWDLLKDKSSLCIQTSWGCPFRCTYCGSYLLNPKFFQKNWEEVLEELIFYAKEYSTTDVAFYDDALLINSNHHIKPLLEGIIRSNLKIRFHTPNALHARFVDKELAHLMKKAGFVTIRFGLESTDCKFQKKTGNKVTNEEIERAVKIMLDSGFERKNLGIYIMFGGFYTNFQTTLNDIKYVTETLRVPVILASYSLVPNSCDYNNWMKAGLLPTSLDPLWHNKTIFPLLTKKYTIEKIRELRKIATEHNKTLRE